MPTVVLNAYSKAYPFITNRIRASVYLQTDPQSLIATIIDTTAGHPQRIYSFPGLPRNNYGFSLDEINGAGVVINNLALFDVVPGQIDGLLTRNDEQIQVDTTPGFTSGENTFVFDGTETAPGSGIFKPNYIGWEIVPSELTGRGILVKNSLDYSWDKDTGIFTLLQSGDVFQVGTYYNIHFNPIQNPAGGSYPTIKDFETILVTATQTLDVSVFGKKLIAEPVGDYIELTLPPISTCPSGRPLMIEVGGTGVRCVKVIQDGSDNIQFLRGNIFINSNESLTIYKFVRSAGVFEWRVSEADGNFKTVGQLVSEDFTQSDVINKKILDGSSEDVLKYARIYNEVVLNLPINQVVDYDVWATGNNKYFYSKANSSNPLNSGKFHFPDRRNLFERNNNTGKAGDYYADTVNNTGVKITVNQGNSYTGNGGPGIVGRGSNSPNTFDIPVTGISTGSETMPKHYLINKYVLI